MVKYKLIALWVALSFVSMRTYFIVHEKVHQIIYSSFGIASKTTIGWFTASTSPLSINAVCNESCIKSHLINEVVGYHFAGGIFIILLIFLIWILSIKD